MTLPTAAKLYRVIDATWPPAKARREGGWIIREGDGGGQRVSAATRDAPGLPDIDLAERAMVELGQNPLFMIREDDAELDLALERRGYAIKDPVVLYAAPVAALAAVPPEPVSAFAIWPPLAVMRDIWARGGVGAGRLRVMERVRSAKTCLLSRRRDRAAGCGFVAISDDIAMVHALEVVPELRQTGAAINMMRLAAGWAQGHGARYISLVVTGANRAANNLYSKLGFEMVGKYHYRTRQ